MKKKKLKYTLRENHKLSDAVILINKLKKKIIFVVNSNKLVGSITDGDIRRFFINSVSANVTLSQIMNSNPKYLYKNFSAKDLKMIDKRIIRYLPIVNKNKEIINIFDIQKYNRKFYENEVVIVAGGYGKRLYPLTKKIPKPMLVIDKKPHLENLIDNLVAQGFKNISICLNFKYAYILKYFKNKKTKANLKFYVEKKPLGTAGPISLLKIDNTLPILVINADLITNLDFSNLHFYHNLTKSDFTVCIKKTEFKLPFAILNTKKEKIMSIKEKPETSFLFNTGIYMLNKKIVDLIPKNKKIDMPDIISKAIKLKKKVNAFYVFEKWFDYGTKENIVKVNKSYKKILSN